MHARVHTPFLTLIHTQPARAVTGRARRHRRAVRRVLRAAQRLFQRPVRCEPVAPPAGQVRILQRRFHSASSYRLHQGADCPEYICSAEAAACCGEAPSASCLVPDASAFFCESVFSALSRSHDAAAAEDGSAGAGGPVAGGVGAGGADAGRVPSQTRLSRDPVPPLPPPILSGQTCAGEGGGRVVGTARRGWGGMATRRCWV